MQSSMNDTSKPSLFSGASPKLTLIFGVIAGVATTAILAFLLILPKLAVSQAVSREGSSATAGADAVPAENAPTPAPSAPTTVTVREVTAEDHVRGDRNAPVKMVEYSDLECPFCKRFHPTLQQVMDELGKDGKVAWVYRHFPLDSLHSKARKEAEATECANALGGNEAFWEYVDRLFAVTPSNNGLDPAQLPVIADEVGLNQQEFERCLDSGKFADHVAADLADANAAGGNGTPYTVILASDGTKIPVSGALPFAQVQAAIEQALQ